MTGPEHYLRAERLLAEVTRGDGMLVTASDLAEYLTAAQVHATLALAAATALNDFNGGSPLGDYRAWRETASVVDADPTDGA